MRKIRTAQLTPQQGVPQAIDQEPVDPTQKVIEIIKTNPQMVNYFREIVKDLKAQAVQQLEKVVMESNEVLEVMEQNQVNDEPDYYKVAVAIAQMHGL